MKQYAKADLSLEVYKYLIKSTICNNINNSKTIRKDGIQLSQSIN